MPRPAALDYESFGAFVERGLPARVETEARSLPGTAAHLFRFRGAQPLPDPAVPEVAVHLLVGGQVRYAADFSFGRFEGTKRVGEFDVAPPDTRGLFEGAGRFELLTWSLPWAEVRRVAAEAGLAPPSDLGRLHARMTACPYMAQSLLQLWEEAEAPGPLGALFRQSALSAAVLRLLRLAGDANPAPQPGRGGLAPWQVRRVREHVEANLAADISLAELAGLCSLSTFHFSRAFRQSLGMPPYAYLTARRVEAARRLLEETGLPVGDVARAVGYDAPAHLARVFRQAMGVTPSEYRRARG